MMIMKKLSVIVSIVHYIMMCGWAGLLTLFFLLVDTDFWLFFARNALDKYPGEARSFHRDAATMTKIPKESVG